jgi:accessory gene regulator B
MSISSLCENLVALLTAELDYNSEKKEIMAYAIETVLLFLIGALLVVFLGFILNALLTTIFAVFFGGSLRRLSGGAHFNSPLKCMIIGSAIYALLGFLSGLLVSSGLTDKIFLVPALLVSFLLVAFLAPADSEAKPIHSRSFKIKLKIAAILFVGISSLAVIYTDNDTLSVSATLGILYQSITLLPHINTQFMKGRSVLP